MMRPFFASISFVPILVSIDEVFLSGRNFLFTCIQVEEKASLFIRTQKQSPHASFNIINVTIAMGFVYVADKADTVIMRIIFTVSTEICEKNCIIHVTVNDYCLIVIFLTNMAIIRL